MASMATVSSSMLDELADVFAAFAGGSEMDGRSFAKCLRDADLVNGRLTLTDVDLVFAACKPRGARKLDLPRFGKALGMVAARKNMSAAAILAAVCVAKAPLYDNGITLPASCDAEIRRVLSNASQACSTTPPAPILQQQQQPQQHVPTTQASAPSSPPPPAMGYVTSIRSTRSVGSLNGETRTPPMPRRDSGERPLPVLLGSLRRTHQDHVADKKKDQNVLPVFESRHSTASSRSGSGDHRVRRGPERFYDSSTYTGTHKFGGPSTAGSAVGQGGYNDLSTLVERGRVQNDDLQRRKRMTGVESMPRSPANQPKVRSPRKMVADVDEFEPQGRITYNVPSPRRVGPERFYYDKSTYTGTHKNGGPQAHGSGVGIDGYSDLSALVVRSHVQDDNLQRRKFSKQGSLSLNALLSPRLEAHRLTLAPVY